MCSIWILYLGEGRDASGGRYRKPNIRNEYQPDLPVMRLIHHYVEQLEARNNLMDQVSGDIAV
jgi:hypothetical protein